MEINVNWRDVYFVFENFRSVMFRPDEITEMRMGPTYDIKTLPAAPCNEPQHLKLRCVKSVTIQTTKQIMAQKCLLNMDPKKITGVFVGDEFYYIVDPELICYTEDNKYSLICVSGSDAIA